MTAQLSRERLEEKLLEHIKHGGDSEEETMIRMLLAGMDNEPVAYMIGGHYLMHAHDPKVDNYSSAVPLYTAPPSPVAVPDVGREQFEAWVKYHLDDEQSIVTLHRANGGLNYRDPHVDLAWIAWKESRASMLQGAENAESRCTIKTAPALDSSPKNAESRSGSSPVVPEGWKLVPVEPTEAMMLHKSGCQHHAWDEADCSMRQTRRLVWAHMLAAAPVAPEQEV